jgi:hypothetical protein
MYTGENDTTWLERSHGADLDARVLETSLSKLSTDSSFTGFITPPMHYMPICMNQAMRSLLLKAMPTLDNIDIMIWQRGDPSHGMSILREDSTAGQRSTNIATCSLYPSARSTVCRVLGKYPAF